MASNDKMEFILSLLSVNEHYLLLKLHSNFITKYHIPSLIKDLGKHLKTLGFDILGQVLDAYPPMQKIQFWERKYLQ